MQKTFSFVNPVHLKGLDLPRLSSEMMYLMTTDVEQHGKDAILRQLSRLFEIDLEEFLLPVLDEKPSILMNYDLFQDEWEYIGDRNDKKALELTYQLAKSMQTGGTDDETEDLMRQEGWSSTVDLKEAVDKMLQLVRAYPFFWRAIKYKIDTADSTVKGQNSLKSYFEQSKPAHSIEEEIVTAFTLDVRELVQYITQLTELKQLWFAKYFLS